MANDKNPEPIVIRDGDHFLELKVKTVGGITVFTTTDEQQKEIKERYEAIIPPFTRRAAS